MKINRLLHLIVLVLFISISGYPQSDPRNFNENYMFTPLFEEFNGTLLSSQWHPTIHYARGIGFLVNSTQTINVNAGNLRLGMFYSRNYMDSIWSDSFGWQTYYKDYIGGEINSNEEYSYGIFECRAKFAHENGSWPAFWTIGVTDLPCRDNNEIDIAELVCDHQNPTLDNVIHYYEPDLNCDSTIHYLKNIKRNPYNWDDNFHIFKCIWTFDKIEYYVDGDSIHTVYNEEEWFPKYPQHIILSQQIIGIEDDSVITPQASYFDYVKVKQFFLSPEITCPSLICNNAAASLSVDTLAKNISWSLSPANKFYTASGTGNTLTISPRYTSFAGTLTFSFRIGPNNESFSVSQNFWIGKPVKPSAITFIPSTPVTNQLVIGLVSSSNTVESNVHYNWRNTHTYIDQNSTGSEVHFQTIDGPLGYTTPVYVSASNTCGTSAELSKLLTVKKGSGGGAAAGAKITPNPTSSEVEIEITEMEVPEGENTNSAIAADVDYNVLIVDSDGIQKYKGKIKDKHLKLNVSGWKRGVYNVLISNGLNTISEKFIVEN